jgi:hypothetical protein
MKGQYFSFDVIIASILAIAVFSILFIYWQQSINNSAIERENLMKELMNYISILTSNTTYNIFISHHATNLSLLSQKVNELSLRIKTESNKYLCVNATWIENNNVESKAYGECQNAALNQVRNQVNIERVFILKKDDGEELALFLTFYLSS